MDLHQVFEILDADSEGTIDAVRTSLSPCSSQNIPKISSAPIRHFRSAQVLFKMVERMNRGMSRWFEVDKV
eukprot:COSAG04_NODE_618_length_11896_cov_81.925659_20_plen_71_part_00